MQVSIPNSAEYRVRGAETSAHDVEFTFPIELIEQLRTEQSTVTLDARLDVKIKKDGFLWFDKRFEGKQPFKLLVAPRVAGQLFSRIVTPKNGWVKRSDLDIVYSNNLPSGHATSSSKVGHHRISRRFKIPRASVPPRIGDRRFYAAEKGACTGGGCSHLHEFRVRVVNNGSELDVYTYNNSHAITVRVKGKVQRYERVSETSMELPNTPIIDGEVIEVRAKLGFEQLVIEGRDMDFGLVDLIVKRDASTTVYPMPEGKWGGLEYLGTVPEEGAVVYRFARSQLHNG